MYTIESTDGHCLQDTHTQNTNPLPLFFSLHSTLYSLCLFVYLEPPHQYTQSLILQHAQALRTAEIDVKSREMHLKSLRDDVERERKGQESMLRDMRAMAIQDDAASERGGNSGSKSKAKGSRR